MTYTTKWLTDKTRVEELVDFFITHKTDSYISHSEIMYGRALDAQHWNPDLRAVFTEQLMTDYDYDGTSKLKILIAENEDEKIVGMLVFNIISSPFKKYAILEDMLLDQAVRGQSLGSKLMEEVITEAKKWDISFIMLESGVNNHGAHHFFGKYGFEKVSESFMLTL
ncbi:N-acetyltransferase [Chryseobacterium lactis]|uniref:N-acetyltransferase n=1 Tax=Chryseobacterium lactis TaxID=1241981 RepID=A0A3G6RLU1_CHRLC|nr:GNAT family N-acetyltransferase [Chryseobacterium lactis]AZA83774.1 GNAT family N-acetyltransferase [Chryseobacterium lactis]AZB04159.1 GNAT family N-acetyltransferase [Chryseobacterium lactis]PNW12932.1 N-acetyltransferase [Chryseobacterium lactis]